MASRCALIASAALWSVFAAPALAAEETPNTPVVLEIGSLGKMNYSLGESSFGLHAKIDTVGTLKVMVNPADLKRRGFKRWEIVAAVDGEPDAVDKVIREAGIAVAGGKSGQRTASGSGVARKRHRLGDVQRLDVKPRSVTVWLNDGGKYGLDRSSGQLRAKGIMPWLRRIARRPRANDVIRPE